MISKTKLNFCFSYLDGKRRMRRRDNYKVPAVLSIYFGVPGAGKTTFAAYLAKKDLSHGHRVYSNVPIKGTIILDPVNDICKYQIENGRVIIDEAGVQYDSRQFKNWSSDSTYFYKYHRHYNLAVDLFSQGYDDMDKKLRTLAQKLYVVKKGLLPFFIHVRPIKKKVGINELTKEICDEYYFVPLSIKIIFSPPLWTMFNTHSQKVFPAKKWSYYE